MEKRKKGKPITISFWNKELSLLANKQGDIIEVIQKYKPLVLGIGWTELKTNNNLADVQQPGFTLHLVSCQASLWVSWCAVYSRNSMVVKRREDLENGGIAALWLQLGIPGQKGILIMCGYCQWRLPNQIDKGAASSLVPANRQRWELIFQQWEKALAEIREVIFTMGSSIVALSWNKETTYQLINQMSNWNHLSMTYLTKYYP